MNLSLMHVVGYYVSHILSQMSLNSNGWIWNRHSHDTNKVIASTEQISALKYTNSPTLCRDGHEPNTIIIIKLIYNVTTHRSIDLEALSPLRSRIVFEIVDDKSDRYVISKMSDELLTSEPESITAKRV